MQIVEHNPNNTIVRMTYSVAEGASLRDLIYGGDGWRWNHDMSEDRDAHHLLFVKQPKGSLLKVRNGLTCAIFNRYGYLDYRGLG
jgi:hypothetical protein